MTDDLVGVDEGWVRASATRNWIADDPILDWLNLYGEVRGYPRDDRRDDHVPEADFLKFILRKGNEFEARVLELLAERLRREGEIVDLKLPAGSREARDRTLELLRQGVPAVYQGALWSEELRVCGAPDLLVRSDLLPLLCEGAPSEAPVGAAPLLGLDVHYIPVEIKFSAIDLNSRSEILSKKNAKVQLAIYHAALTLLQGFAPVQAFVIGRGWEKGDEKVMNCLDRLLPVSLPEQQNFRGGPTNWLAVAQEAIEWLRRVREEGASWQVGPKPSIPELHPNVSNTQDAPWHSAKKQIAAEQGELTALWRFGVADRKRTLLGGISDWRDPRFEIAAGGKDTQERQRKMLAINRDPAAPQVDPAPIPWKREEWAEPEDLEFFVDFETTSNLDDDFTKLPEAGGQPLIFMIGCGHFEPVGESSPGWQLDPNRRRWVFKIFFTPDLTEYAERQMIYDWAAYMAGVRKATPGAPALPKVFHWSPAETRTYKLNDDSAFNRHLKPTDWPLPNWYDFLEEVVRPAKTSDAFLVRGSWGFGLKAIGKALFKLGLIQTEWTDGPADGLQAMSGAWECYRLSLERGIPVQEVVMTDVSGRQRKLYEEICDYNEVDCKVMAEAIQFVRGL